MGASYGGLSNAIKDAVEKVESLKGSLEATHMAYQKENDQLCAVSKASNETVCGKLVYRMNGHK